MGYIPTATTVAPAKITEAGDAMSNPVTLLLLKQQGFYVSD